MRLLGGWTQTWAAGEFDLLFFDVKNGANDDDDGDGGGAGRGGLCFGKRFSHIPVIDVSL